MLPPVPNAKDTQNPHLGAALARVAPLFPAERVAQVWIFPPRRVGAKESGLAVLVVTAEDPADARRTIWTLRYEAEAGKGGKMARTDTLDEQGTVPPDRVNRIVDGVVRRLEGEGDAPDVRELDGDAEAWHALLVELGSNTAVDASNR
ncbi:hypothetical protein [Longimicrobium sp.]|uniref:hypothetical protein n=1 Tax=Longimicrobium sp. TaxID=2029185 RepID=UPI002BAA67FA|nr:hypothetical protein [Longimicrobium sp.]HSU15803.1 hypothetical protein [Longimicrobium sp.]